MLALVTGVPNVPIVGAHTADEKRHAKNEPKGRPETALSMGIANIKGGKHHSYSYTSVGDESGCAPGGYSNEVYTSVIVEAATRTTNGEADRPHDDVMGSNSPKPQVDLN